MTGQAAGFWKVRHAVIGMAVVGMLAVVMTRSCGGDAEHTTRNETGEPEQPKQGMYVQVPASQSQPRYAEPQGYPQPAYGQQQPGYVYSQQPPVVQQQPGYAYSQQQPLAQQPAYGYSAQPPVQQQYQAAEPGSNPWANPVPGYQPQQPAQWGQPQAPQVQQWGKPQQPVYSQLPGSSSQYRPLDDTDQNRQSTQTVTIAVPVPGWSAAPYDRRGGSSFGNSTPGSAWSGGYAGYGYNPAYPAAPYGAGGWPGGYPAGWPAGAYPGYGLPGRW